LAQVNDDYVATAIAGTALSPQAERLLEAGRRLAKEQGADVVLLGGTDLSLVYDDAADDFAVIDSALVHVSAIANAALENR
jgi:aspartate racemase